MPLSDFQKSLASKAGMTDTEIAALTPENYEAKICERVDANTQKLMAAVKGGKDGRDGSDAGAEDGADDGVTAGAEPVAASRGKRAKANPLVVKTVAQGRIATIDAAVKAGELNKAAADKLKERFCKSETVSLALSRGDDGSDFDAVMETIRVNKTTVGADGKERTGAQVGDDAVELSRGGGGKDDANSLVADAERRAKEHNERFRK